MSKLNESELIELWAAKCGLELSKAEKDYNTLLDLIVSNVAKGRKVVLQGFGKFTVTKRKARLGINPRTLEPMTIPPVNSPKFTAGEAFKRAVN